MSQLVRRTIGATTFFPTGSERFIWSDPQSAWSWYLGAKCSTSRIGWSGRRPSRCLQKPVAHRSLSLQQDIRAGDQLMQINGTSVEVLKFAEIQNMLEHANSNQIHLTCVPYREPQAQPVLVTVNQSENLPSVLLPSTTKNQGSDSNWGLSRLAESDASREDDPRTRSIAVGQETCIEIDRGQSGLGLSVVGGSDTQLVKRSIQGGLNNTCLFLVCDHCSWYLWWLCCTTWWSSSCRWSDSRGQFLWFTLSNARRSHSSPTTSNEYRAHSGLAQQSPDGDDQWAG